jgi:prevent-host-death family protein
VFITSTEFKTNLGKYLDLVEHEEIIILRNGKRVAKLVDASDKSDLVKALKGVLPAEATLEAAKEERLARQ